MTTSSKAFKDNKKGKCYKMHVGRNKEECKNMKVHDKEFIEIKYLGEILSSDSKNTKMLKQEHPKNGYSQ